MKKSVQEIKKLLKKSEGKSLEFKLCKNKLGDSFWETYSAFSNTSGGIIILGIEEENSNVKNIVGVSDYNRIINEIVNNANSLQNVSYNSLDDVYYIEIEEDIVLVIVDILSVDSSKKPVYLKGNIKKSYIRMAESDQIMNDDLLKAYIINSKDTLDIELLQETYSIDDINLDSVKRYREC